MNAAVSVLPTAPHKLTEVLHLWVACLGASGERGEGGGHH